jgi:hypothetical protein
MKKIYTLAILIVELMLYANTLYAQTYSGGSGTTDDPYLIANKADLKYLSEHSSECSKHFEMTADITFEASDFQSGGDFYNSGEGFIPIGTGASFSGTFNGDGYSISNVLIYTTTAFYTGFFYFLSSNYIIENLNLVDVNIIGDSYTGGLCGRTNGGSISNCSVSGTITGENYTGGLVGYLHDTDVNQCRTNISVNGNQYVGGLFGLADDYNKIINIEESSTAGSVSGVSYVGGFIGKLNIDGHNKNCYSYADVVRKYGTAFSVASFCGYAMEGDVHDCYTTGSVNCLGAVSYVDHGFVGSYSSTDTEFYRNYLDSQVSNQTSCHAGAAEPKTTAEMKMQTTFVNWDFGIIWVMDRSEGGNGYPHLKSEYPAVVIEVEEPAQISGVYQISSLAELNWIAIESSRWGYDYIQTADIDAYETNFWYDLAGWIPIGNTNIHFSGSYDGNGFEISNLNIYTNSSYQGLFGYVEQAQLSNIKLTNVSCYGDNHIGGIVGYAVNNNIAGCSAAGLIDGGDNVGGIVGYAVNSNIEECKAACLIDGGDKVGGLAGSIENTLITKSSSSGEAKSVFNVGGLVGSALSNSEITYSYSLALVEGKSTSSTHSGGLVGRLDAAVIKNSYAYGDVQSDNISYSAIYIGGLVGGCYANSEITNCYSRGDVDIIFNQYCSAYGGLIGSAESSDINYCFWDIITSGQNISAGGTGKTTDEMKVWSTYTNWAPSFWEIIGGDGANYPTLRGNPETETPTVQASNIICNNAISNQIDITWTNGDGNARVVFAKKANSGTTHPTVATTYTAHSVFGSGTEIGSTGWYCIYNGSGSSVSVSNLSVNTDYIFQVFEYNGNIGTEIYLSSTATDNPKVHTTNNTPAPNYALTFDGTDDYVSTNYNSEIQTLEFWIKRDAHPTQYYYTGICSQCLNIVEDRSDWYMTWGDAGTYYGYKIRIKTYTSNTSSVELVTTTSFDIGKWYHVALTSQENSLKFYVNGVFDSELTNLGVVLGSTTDENFIFGGYGYNNFVYEHNGEMDEVRIWNVVRSQEEIQENMCKKLAGNETGLLAYYQMTNGSGTTLTDLSPNIKNGTLMNMNDDNWVASGAAIGDASIADYSSPTSVNLASAEGDNVTIGTITGSPVGVQVYRVDGTPNVTTSPGNLNQISPNHHFGVFIVGGTSPTYTLTYNYEGQSLCSDESSLDLAFRANNATTSWTEGDAALNTTAKTLTLTGQTGTEYILGTEAITWDGSESTDWATAENWNSGGIPSASDNLIIADVANDPVISSGTGASCNNLTINSGASLTVNSGGSLITNGTITNNGTIPVNQTIAEDGHWHLIAMPNNNTTANEFNGMYLQQWDEPSASWADITDPATALTPVKGYSLWSPSAKGSFTYTGTPNTGNQSIAITANGSGGSYNGANLLGNPYPSSIDWDGLRTTYGAVYYWNGTAYVSWNNGGDGVQYVPPMQGFFIVADAEMITSTSGFFNLNNTNRTHSGATAFYKSGDSKPVHNGLVLQATNGSYNDELWIMLNDQAGEDFELQNDAWKFKTGTPGISQLWSVCGDGELSIDARPYQETIQLGFANDQSGIYSISLKAIEGIGQATLEDTKTSTFHDLAKDMYEFAWDITDDEKRFKLHLNAVGIEETSISGSNILIYAADGQIFIKNGNDVETHGRASLQHVTVSDVMGRVVLQQEIPEGDLVAIPVNLQTGVYVVTVQNGSEIKSEKVFIK